MTATALPGFTVRPPSAEDAQIICDLITAFDMAHLGFSDALTPQDVLDDWHGEDPSTNARLFFAPDGMLAGYGMVGEHGSGQLWADGYVRPGYEGRGIGSAILRFSEARARELVDAAPAGARVVLANSVLLSDERAAQLFEAYGYTFIRVHYRMAIEMSAEPARPTWPEGVELRNFVPGQDEHAVFDCAEEAFADHWGHVPRRFEDWVERTQRADFDPSLWFLAADAADPNRVAGISLCRKNPDQGWLNTLAVRRPWRQRGLGTALLHHTFAEFWRRGERKVGLGVDSQNLTGALRLYESAGMRPTMRIATYEKELRPGVDLSTRELAS